MKNLIKSIAIVVMISGIASCSSLNNQGSSVNDGVYFVPGQSDESLSSHEKLEVENMEIKTTLPAPEPTITNQRSENAYQERQAQYDDENYGDQIIYNQNTTNYYYNEPYYDFRYSQRIKRFHRPYSTIGYYHNIYSWPYYSPYYYGSGWRVSVGYSSRPYYHHHYPYHYYPYHYPYYGYYNPYYMPHYNYSTGYHHGYHHGYYHGYHGGYYSTGIWSGSTTSGSSVSKPVSTTHVGQRSSSGSTTGGNISSSTPNQVRGSRMELPPLDDNEDINDQETDNSSAPDNRTMTPHDRRQSYPQSERNRDSYSSGSSGNQTESTPRNSGSREVSTPTSRENNTSTPTYRRNDVSAPQNNTIQNRETETSPRSRTGGRTNSPGSNNNTVSPPPSNNTTPPSNTSSPRRGGR